MKSFENFELFQEAPTTTGAPTVNDRNNADNSSTAVRDRTAGNRADQANTARGNAAALPGTAAGNTVQGYNQNADALRKWIMSLSEADRDLLQERIKQEFLLVGDAIKKNADVLRTIEQMKASFSGMCQIVSVFARALGATEIADGAMNMARELTPQPVMPALGELESFGNTVIGSLPASVQANARAALGEAIGELRRGEAEAPNAGTRAVAGAAGVNPGPANATTATTAGGATTNEVRYTSAASQIMPTLSQTDRRSLNGVFARLDPDNNGMIDRDTLAAALAGNDKRLGTQDDPTGLSLRVRRDVLDRMGIHAPAHAPAAP